MGNIQPLGGPWQFLRAGKVNAVGEFRQFSTEAEGQLVGKRLGLYSLKDFLIGDMRRRGFCAKKVSVRL